MAMDERTDETTVNDRYAVTIPAPIRDRLDIEPGDSIRWTVTEEGSLEVEVVSQRFGVLEGFEPVDMGETAAAQDHDIVAADVDQQSG